MKTHSLFELAEIAELAELVSYAKKNSPFYQNLYKDIKDIESGFSLGDLPILDSHEFWLANHGEKNSLLTSKQSDGVVFKSGGTSGNPKFSYFTLKEWEIFTRAFGEGLSCAGLRAGDRVANLFYAGDLYASFLFITKSLEACQTPLIHFPLTGQLDLETITKSLNQFEIDVWAGVPTTIVQLAEHSEIQHVHPPKKILFGGESLYADQREFILRCFPNTMIQSIGYASVDGGLLGYSDEECHPQEHWVFQKYTIMEILDDDTHQPITQINRPGKLYLTNLTRKLMPIIRYPVGDRAEWINSDLTKFKILGRSEEGARVGPATVYYEDIAMLLQSFHDKMDIKGFQLVITHYENKDQLTIRIATNKHIENHRQHLLKVVEVERSFLHELAQQKKIHPVNIEFVDSQHLEKNQRTGKLKRVLDKRI